MKLKRVKIHKLAYN